jgi:hypothetical protein
MGSGPNCFGVMQLQLPIVMCGRQDPKGWTVFLPTRQTDDVNCLLLVSKVDTGIQVDLDWLRGIWSLLAS